MKDKLNSLINTALLTVYLFLTWGTCYSISYTENKGQWNKDALFKANLRFGNVFLLNDGFLFTVHDKAQLKHIHETGFANAKDEKIRCHSYQVTFLNANAATIHAYGEANTYKNYFIGNDSMKWKNHVKSYSEIFYKNIYNNIDLKVYSVNDNFKYDFILNPGARIEDIRMKVDGLDQLIMENQSLVYVTSISSVKEVIPIAYVENVHSAERITIPCAYSLYKNIISFNLPQYSGLPDVRIVIDPVLLISTYSGSSGTTYGSSATYDSKGNLFIGAMLFDTGWPYTLGAYDITFSGGIDIGITKFDTTGANQMWSGYIGGTDDDVLLNLATNANDELFIFCHTGSGYPVTSGAYDMTYNGLYDIGVTRISQNGASLLGSTYIGGSDDDGRSLSLSMNVHSFGDLDKGEIQIDGSGNPVIASLTRSSNFPVTTGAYQVSHGGNIDGCVFKLNSSLTQMLFCSYIGGNDDEACYGLSLDANARLVITGGTNSSDFPVTSGAYQSTYSGGFSYQFDSFISIIDATGSNLVSSTYFGYNNSKDKGYKSAIDSAGNIYNIGNSEGILPISAGVFSTQNTGNYVLKFNPSLTTLLKCTAYGDGTSFPNLQPIAFHIDGCNKIFCAGFTSSNVATTTLFPVTPGAQQTTPNGTQDIHVIVFNADFASVAYASYLGGAVREHTDAGSSKFDPNGVLYLGVCTEESFMGGFPVTPNAFCPSSQTPDWDMAGVKWDLNGCPLSLSTNGAPSIAMASSDTVWCDKKAIDFFDLSTNNPTSWQWYFQGATPDTSSMQNPTGIYYPANGTWDVKLVACNSNGCDSVTYSAFITEFPTPATPTIMAYGDTLCASTYVSYQWYEASSPTIVLSTNQCLISPSAGNYFVVVTDTNGCQTSSQTIVMTVGSFPDYFSQINISPNPFIEHTTLMITSERDQVIDFEITNTLGMRLMLNPQITLRQGLNRLPINMSGINQGMYFCKIQSEKYSRIIKLIKTKQ